MATTTTIGPATRIEGKLESDEDLNVEGRIEGGPINVRGRLTVAPRGIVLAEEAEVREALIVGVFVGNLHAHDVVRIHQDGRIVGDVVAPRVVFVSDKPVGRAPKAQPSHAPAAPAAPPPRAEEPAPVEAAPVEAAPADSAQRSAAPSIDSAQRSAAPSTEAPRSIPPLPGIGQRSMHRKE